MLIVTKPCFAGFSGREKGERMQKERAPVSPGEVIIHEYLDPLGWCVDDLADRSGRPVNKLRTILYNIAS